MLKFFHLLYSCELGGVWDTFIILPHDLGLYTVVFFVPLITNFQSLLFTLYAFILIFKMYLIEHQQNNWWSKLLLNLPQWMENTTIHHFSSSQEGIRHLADFFHIYSYEMLITQGDNQETSIWIRDIRLWLLSTSFLSNKYFSHCINLSGTDWNQ